MRPSKITSRIVLLGGGHSHVQFLKSWRENLLPGVEVYLVSREAWTPYSGMLPSRLAGWYRDEEMHFDLLNLCAQSGVIFLADEVVGLDVNARRIFLRDHPPLSYDVVSINIGITPVLPGGADGHPNVLVVKPISELLAKWEKIRSENRSGRWVVVGGGAAGFELAVILKQLVRGQVALLESGPHILPTHPAPVRRKAEKILRDSGIELLCGREVECVAGQELICRGGEKIPFDQTLIATGAAAASWLAQSGLPVNKNGFVRVDRCLQVEHVVGVFAAGDCADFVPRPLPKSGVFAVREGPVLIENIRCTITGGSLIPYRPQKRTLSLLVSGPKRALFSYRGLEFEGEWVWRLKDRIDRRFMRRFGVHILGRRG